MNLIRASDIETGFVTASYIRYMCMYVNMGSLRTIDGRRDGEYLNWLTCNVCLSLYELFIVPMAVKIVGKMFR